MRLLTVLKEAKTAGSRRYWTTRAARIICCCICAAVLSLGLQLGPFVRATSQL